MGKKRGVGKPLKLTDELQDKLCGLLRVGVTIEDACTECGICRDTFQKWQARALEKEEPLFLKFLHAVDRAKAQSKIRSLIRMDKAAVGDWRADAWLLERRFPDEFGKRDQVKVHQAEKGEEFRPPGSHAKLLAHIDYLEQEYQKDVARKTEPDEDED
jgi:transposase